MQYNQAMQCSQEELTTLAVSYCNATVHSKCSHGKGVITFTVFTIVYTTRLLRQSFGKGGQLSYSGEDHFPTQGWADALLKWGPLYNSRGQLSYSSMGPLHRGCSIRKCTAVLPVVWHWRCPTQEGHQAHSRGQLSMGLESA